MNVKYIKDHGTHRRGETAEVKDAYAMRLVGQGLAVPVKRKASARNASGETQSGAARHLPLKGKATDAPGGSEKVGK